MLDHLKLKKNDGQMAMKFICSERPTRRCSNLPRTSAFRSWLLTIFIGVCLFAVLGSESVLQGAAPQPTSVIQIVIGPDGFRQSRVVQKSGWVYFCVFNRAIRNGVHLRLDQQATTPGSGATKIRDVNIDLTRQDWRESIFLDPGTYLLTETGHAKWMCTIVIQ